MEAFVTCPETITSPAPDPGFPLPANKVCGLKCEVHRIGQVMEFRCARGHHFLATRADVKSEVPQRA